MAGTNGLMQFSGCSCVQIGRREVRGQGTYLLSSEEIIPDPVCSLRIGSA